MYEMLLLLHADTVKKMLPHKIYIFHVGLRYARPGEIRVSWKHAYPSAERVEGDRAEDNADDMGECYSFETASPCFLNSHPLRSFLSKIVKFFEKINSGTKSKSKMLINRLMELLLHFDRCENKGKRQREIHLYNVVITMIVP